MYQRKRPKWSFCEISSILATRILNDIYLYIGLNLSRTEQGQFELGAAQRLGEDILAHLPTPLVVGQVVAQVMAVIIDTLWLDPEEGPLGNKKSAKRECENGHLYRIAREFFFSLSLSVIASSLSFLQSILHIVWLELESFYIQRLRGIKKI